MKRGWFFLLAVMSAGVYLAFAFVQNGAFGFPLDDAWIHQVVARQAAGAQVGEVGVDP